MGTRLSLSSKEHRVKMILASSACLELLGVQGRSWYGQILLDNMKLLNSFDLSADPGLPASAPLAHLLH